MDCREISMASAPEIPTVKNSTRVFRYELISNTQEHVRKEQVTSPGQPLRHGR